MPRHRASTRRRAKDVAQAEGIKSLIQFVNDGHATISAGSNQYRLEHPALRALLADVVFPELLAAGRVGRAPTVDLAAILALRPSRLVLEPLPELPDGATVADREARCAELDRRIESLREVANVEAGATFAEVIVRLYFLHPNVAAFQILGQCRRQRCQRWFLERHGHQAFCSPACAGAKEAELRRASGPRRRVRAKRPRGEDS